MYYVGLDIHQRSTDVEILDCNGKLVKRATAEKMDAAGQSHVVQWYTQEPRTKGTPVVSGGVITRDSQFVVSSAYYVSTLRARLLFYIRLP